MKLEDIILPIAGCKKNMEMLIIITVIFVF